MLNNSLGEWSQILADPLAGASCLYRMLHQSQRLPE